MKEATRIGIDLAKNIFHLVGMDACGGVVWRKALARRKLLEFLAQQKALEVGMEACATAHYWGREIQKLGHRVRLIHPRFVTPYRKNDKNDFNDAEAVAEAMSRPTMRFVELKSLAQQDMQSLHQARRLLIKQRTQSANQLRGLLAEYGVVAPRGLGALRRAVAELSGEPQRVTPLMAALAAASVELLAAIESQRQGLDRRVEQACRSDERCRRLSAIRGVGPLTATAAVAKVGNARQFPKARALGAFVGLVPRQHSSGGKTVLGGISKRGDRYLRTLLIHGARAALRTAAQHEDRLSRWALGLQQKRGANAAAVALANKHARIIWKLLTTGAAYDPQHPTTAAERAPAAQAAASQKSAGRRLALRLEHGQRSRGFFSPSSHSQ
jgi:transposase